MIDDPERLDSFLALLPRDAAAVLRLRERTTNI
jgi:hypothetical protein